MAENESDRLRAYLLLAVMPLFFSSNLVIGRAAVASVEPWSLAFFRWFGAFLILLPFAWSRLRGNLSSLFAQWEMIGTLGILGMWICGALVYFALRVTTATNATLIYTSSPVFIVLIERVFRGRNVAPIQMVGILLAIFGVAIIVMKGDLTALTRLDFNGGDVIIGIAAISWAVYSALLKKPALQALPTIVLFTAIAFAGALSLFPFMVWESLATGSFPTGLPAWTSIAGLSLVSSVLAFSTFQYGVKKVGPSIAGIFMYLLPPYGVGMAILFLGEPFRIQHALGLVSVMLGVILATAPFSLIDSHLRRRRQRHP